jgi:NADH-quinone oxidoreductase subunit L
MPATHKTFFVAALAIAGIPPLSGFFSKDEILWKAFSQGSVFFWIIGWLIAGMTAFYMFRLVLLTFEGQPRWGHDKHPHESPKVMTVPLMILALLSVIGGFVGIPESLGGSNAIEHWLAPVFEQAERILPQHEPGNHAVEYLLMALSVIVALGAISLAWFMYTKRKEAPDAVATRLQPVYKLLWNKYYIDELYDLVIVAPIKSVSDSFLWKIFDVKGIDGLVNGTARVVGYAGDLLRRVQTGVVQNYATVFVIGIIVVLGILMLR